jgi:hypothetical protein
MGNSLCNERISARCMMVARAGVAAHHFLLIDHDKDAYLADLHSIMARGYRVRYRRTGWDDDGRCPSQKDCRDTAQHVTTSPDGLKIRRSASEPSSLLTDYVFVLIRLGSAIPFAVPALNSKMGPVGLA